MKKILFLCTIVFLVISSASAKYVVNWANYDLIDTGNDVTRGLAYNPQTDHILVPSRINDEINIFILEATTGDTIGRMNTEGIEGGTYAINLIDVADDGFIYVCNLSAPVYTPSSTFKIYEYQNESATPVLVFDNVLDTYRMGDAFAVAGSGNDKYFYTSGWQMTELSVLKDNGSGTVIFDKYITLPIASNARHGISPVSPGGSIWINGGADNAAPALISANGDPIAVIPDSLASSTGTSSILHLNLGLYDIVCVTNAFPATVRSVKYFEDILGTYTFDFFGENSDSLALAYYDGINYTIMNNTNATAVLDYDSRRHSLISLVGYNSIASVSLDSLIKASTPRDDIWTVTIDGMNDFFPTDHVGSSNGRDMFLTWSSGKFFTGFTGETLIDAALQNRMYVAFDLDPSGTEGSTTPPEDAGGVQALPFKADVVIMTDSYSAEDYMIGEVYKWNGSQWEDNTASGWDYRGNNASQGVLAYSSTGDTALTEIAAVMNDKGIGTNYTDISVMAYMADKDASDDVICAFPDKNPIGNGVTFDHYYYIPELGTGMYPADPVYVQVKTSTGTAVNDQNQHQVQDFRLIGSYPNPFNPAAKIVYHLSHNARVKIDVFDISGRLVSTLIDSKQTAGEKTVTFNGARLSSGVYVYRLTVNHKIIGSRKMLLVK